MINLSLRIIINLIIVFLDPLNEQVKFKNLNFKKEIVTSIKAKL